MTWNTRPFSRRSVLGGSTLAVGTLLFPSPTLALSSVPFSFLVIGDWGRRGGDYQKHVARWMATEASRVDARIVASTGDNFYKLGVSSVEDSHWDESFERIYTEQSLDVPWYAVLGNHDYGGDIRAQLKRNGRGRWRMPERWYAVSGHGLPPSGGVPPDIDLFFIDTAVWHGEEGFPFNLFGSKVDPADQAVQRHWLEETLSASTATYKLVFGHYPIYSVGPHGGTKAMQDLDGLLKRYGVTAYVNGHDHCLYHIHSDAMDYICSGGGSQELTTFRGDPQTYGCVIPGECAAGGEHLSWKSFVDRAGFASFTLDVDGLHFRLIDRFGALFHEDTIRARSPRLDVGA